MTDFSQIDQMHGDLIALRRDIHAHPETAFEENRTAQIVAEKLEEFGLEVATGIGKTGVVGSLKCGSGNRYSPEMINTPLETDTAVSVAKSLVGDKNVVDDNGVGTGRPHAHAIPVISYGHALGTHWYREV